MADFDAIVIGSGHNGLVAACYLARAGWRIALLEMAPEVGGALRSGAVTLPGFYHDRYATAVGQFLASPAYQELKPEFDRLGVRPLRSDKSYASIYRGRALRVYTDSERTRAELGRMDPADGAGWGQLTDFFRRTAPRFLPIFYTELPSAAMVGHVRRIAGSGLGDAFRLARLLRQTSSSFAGSYLHSPEARGLLAAWAFHIDFGPTTPGGAVFAFVAAMAAQAHGLAIVQGGANRLAAALQTMIENAGGKVITGAEVTNIVVKRGRAVAVRTRSGQEMSAARAVVANVTTRNLFTKLLAPDVLPSSFRSRAARFRYGPGTMVIHFAMDRLPQWQGSDDLQGFNYLHINGREEELAETYRQSLRNLLPSRPLLIVSQTTPIDPSRAPPGKHVMRVHIRTVPGRIEGDAGGTITARTWSDAKSAFVERVIDQVEEHAPDLRSCILATAIETPEDIERENPNFIGGDCVSGSHHFDQNFLFRPLAGWSRYNTPIEGLHMIGSSTWPGGGLNAGSGYLLARKLLDAS